MNYSFVARERPSNNIFDPITISISIQTHRSQTCNLQNTQIHQPNQAFDYNFLDQVITFRKKNPHLQSPHQDPSFLQEQANSIKKLHPQSDLKKREQRAKTQLFEYSEQIIQKDMDSDCHKGEEAVRLPNLSAQLSAFKQEKNTFLKELISKKCKEKLITQKKSSLKSLSTQISCEKIWLKRRKSFTLNTKSSTEEMKSVSFDKDATVDLYHKLVFNGQASKLYKKAIVMSLPQNYQANFIGQKTPDKIQNIKLGKIQTEVQTKQLKNFGKSNEKQAQNLASLMISNKRQEAALTPQRKIQKRAASQNRINNEMKKAVREKVERIRSTCSEYLKQERIKLIEGLHILNVSKEKSPHKRFNQLQSSDKKENESQSLAAKTKKRMLSIFKKIHEQKMSQKNNVKSVDSLASIKIDSKDTYKLSCLGFKELRTESVNAKSSVLRSVKQDVKLNRANIIDSLKLFAESKKTRHILDLLNNEGNKIPLGMLSRQKLVDT